MTFWLLVLAYLLAAIVPAWMLPSRLAIAYGVLFATGSLVFVVGWNMWAASDACRHGEACMGVLPISMLLVPGLIYNAAMALVRLNRHRKSADEAQP